MSNKWTIFSKDGVAKYVSDNLEYIGTWMGECSVQVIVKSSIPVDFEIGDYIEYRGEEFVLANDPAVIKKARRGSYGEGFTYDNIKFSALHVELTDIRFLDYVLYDNNLHYTALPSFPFYAADIDDYCDRLQANTNRWCEENGYEPSDHWLFVTPNKAKFIQRAITTGISSVTATDIWNDTYGDDGSRISTSDEKKDVSVSVSNQSIWDALSLIKSDFGLNFINRSRRVIIGSAGLPTNHIFEYGKGNGLHEMERQADSEQQVVTKLYAYGSEKNMPVRYYANLTRRPYFIVSEKETDDSGSLIIKTEIPYSTIETAINGQYFGWLKFGDMTCEAQYDKSVYEGEGVKMLELNLWGNGNVTKDQFYNALSVGSKVYLTSGVNVDKWNTHFMDYDSDGMPNNMAVSHLMLPGFPLQSLYDWVKANGGTDCDDETGRATWKGYTAIFSKERFRPYIQSLNSEELGIKESSKTFDGSDDTDEIYPTIENTGADTIYHAEVVSDNGIFEEGENEPTITLTLPNLGEINLKDSLNDKTQDGGTPTIAMKDGYCGAREFEIQEATLENNKWVVKCKREYDDLLQLYFPYSYSVSQGGTAVADEPYQVRGSDLPGYDGDHFVLTGIKMPSFYINKAAEKMLEASLEFLSKNDYTRYTYLPKVDELFMARQHDEYLHGQSLRSLYLTIKEGDLLRFQDEDLRIGDSLVFIDTLTIKENGNADIPTYEVTLRSDKTVGTFQRILNQIDSMSSSSGGGVGGGGYNANQINNIIEGTGEKLFLSKVKEDVAQEVIGFAKGLWVKAKGVFGFDEDGNIKANDVNAAGDVKVDGQVDVAGRGKIDHIESHNYTGDGLADTGFRMIADDGTGSSSLVIDNVHIRKKLTAEELEVKKETAIAGNQVYSSAANVINRTDYFDANGNKLGYSDQRRPWLVKGMPLMLQGFFFGRVVETRIYLNPEDVSNIAYIRCYFLAKDDDTEVENMWMVGDLARCQSINIKNTKRNIYIKDYAPISNRQVFWWRKVVAVSSQPLHNDDDGRDYHWFDVSMSASASGSDIPAAGDHVVQFGNDIVTNRQNIITAEVSNNDSPALKFYHGINSFSLDNKRIIALRYNPETGRPIIEDYGDAFIGARDNSTYIKYDSLNKLLEVKARISAQSTIGNQLIDTYINKLITDITDDIQTQVDKKAETWYQQANPETNWYNPHATPPLDERSEHVGDLWYCTADNAGTAYKKNTTWYYEKNGNTYSWKQQNIPQSVFDTIDGKANIYVAWNAWGNDLHVRDLYIPNADHTEGSGQSAITYKKDKVYRCTNASTPTFEEINYTDDTALTDFVNVTYSADQANLQNQIDGKYETWFYEGVPTLNNQPASQWTTESDKDAHVGDLYWDKTNSHAYRFVENSSTYSWLRIGDEGVIAAMAQAAAAQDTADNKRRVFTSTPTTPYDVGDLWTEGPNGDIKKCKTARATGNYQASDWEKASKYTDDSALDTFKANQYVKALTDGVISQSITNAANAASGADSKARAAQAAAEAAASDASSANNRLSDWASDSKISPQEKTALEQQKYDIIQEYSQICSNADKYGISKNAFQSAYTSAIAAFNKYTASTPENITVESDYTNIASYYSARTTIMNEIAEAAKKVADDAQDIAKEAYELAEGAKDKVDILDTVKAALNGATLIDGGLLLTSLIALRHYKGTGDKEDVDNYNTYGGMNGIYLNDSTIAAWFGGSMEDRYNSSTQTYDTTNSGKATSLFRMDGSGYFARGNFNWDNVGNVNVKNGYFEGEVNVVSDKGAWKIEPSLLGLLASPIIRGIDKNGNDIVHFMFDGDPEDAYNVVLGGGMYFTNGQEPNISYYLREGWRVRSKNADPDVVDNGIIGDPGSDTYKKPRIAVYSNYKTIDYKSPVIEMGINAYSGGNSQGAYLYSNDWKQASRASNGETYVDAWGNLKVKTSQNLEQFNFATSDFSLPAGAPIGTIYFCKALSSPYYMTVSVTSSSWDTIISANSMEQNSSVEIGDNSAFFVKMTANKWVMFWSE